MNKFIVIIVLIFYPYNNIITSDNKFLLLNQEENLKKFNDGFSNILEEYLGVLKYHLIKDSHHDEIHNDKIFLLNKRLQYYYLINSIHKSYNIDKQFNSSLGDSNKEENENPMNKLNILKEEQEKKEGEGEEEQESKNNIDDDMEFEEKEKKEGEEEKKEGEEGEEGEEAEQQKELIKPKKTSKLLFLRKISTQFTKTVQNQLNKIKEKINNKKDKKTIQETQSQTNPINKEITVTEQIQPIEIKQDIPNIFSMDIDDTNLKNYIFQLWDTKFSQTNKDHEQSNEDIVYDQSSLIKNIYENQYTWDLIQVIKTIITLDKDNHRKIEKVEEDEKKQEELQEVEKVEKDTNNFTTINKNLIELKNLYFFMTKSLKEYNNTINEGENLNKLQFHPEYYVLIHNQQPIDINDDEIQNNDAKKIIQNFETIKKSQDNIIKDFKNIYNINLKNINLKYKNPTDQKENTLLLSNYIEMNNLKKTIDNLNIDQKNKITINEFIENSSIGLLNKIIEYKLIIDNNNIEYDQENGPTGKNELKNIKTQLIEIQWLTSLKLHFNSKEIKKPIEEIIIDMNNIKLNNKMLKIKQSSFLVNSYILSGICLAFLIFTIIMAIIDVLSPIKNTIPIIDSSSLDIEPLSNDLIETKESIDESISDDETKDIEDKSIENNYNNENNEYNNENNEYNNENNEILVN